MLRPLRTVVVSHTLLFTSFRFVTVPLLTLAVVLPAGAPEDERPPSNLEVMRTLAERIGTRVGEELRSSATDTVSVNVQPRSIAWYVESSLLKGMRSSGKPLRLTSPDEAMANFALNETTVRYEDARADGFLGSTIADRLVTVRISSVVRNPSGILLFGDELTESSRDTIEVSLIQSLENPNIPETRGTPPSEGFFSGVAGPLIIIGAVGVAVFLLFHVRS